MASYRGHLTFSSILGAGYGAATYWYFGHDWGVAAVAGGMTAIGGLLPDLDSDSGVPVREMFGLAAVVVPFLLIGKLEADGLTHEQSLAVLAAVYCFIRFGLSALFKRITVHRGMYHSVPAMLIAGLLVFLGYEQAPLQVRLLMAGGIMLGFLSHLVLDELCSVDFSGVTIHLNKFAGSALKFFSPSWPATLLTYSLLAGLLYVTSLEFGGPKQTLQDLRSRTLNILASVPTK